MNQLAMATAMPDWMPAMATPRPTPKKAQKCHGWVMAAKPSIHPAMSMPETTMGARAPRRSRSTPMAAEKTEPAKLPVVKARDMVARVQPSSSPMGRTKTARTGPNMVAEAKLAMAAEITMLQP